MALMPVVYHALSIQGVMRHKGSLHYQIMTDLPVLQWGLNKRSPGSESFSHRENLCLVLYALNSSAANKKQLSSLDSYFRKLHSNSSNWEIQKVKTSVRNKAEKELETLDHYIDKLNDEDSGVNSEDYVSSTFDDQMTIRNHIPLPVSRSSLTVDEKELKSFRMRRSIDSQRRPKELPQVLHQYDEISDLYLISIVASVNIAVFLFELASPVKNTEFELFSVPLLYGAKINDLIMVGEWWRLLTPMFLHSGLVHVALGCWSLLTFGPQVCRGYGSFTFFLIYILGGISGNLTSFLHTPASTVGGTGPVFAIIGSWLIYQIQNKDETTKEVSDKLFQKAMIITGLCFILSHFGPIDDWTHLGAVFTGIVYGYFTCPTLQLDNALSRTDREEGMSFVRRGADPCKSFVLFSAFVLALSSLLLFIEPPHTMLASYDFVL